MKVHIGIPALFLPQEVAADACTGLNLPALETMLARARPEPLPPSSLESWLCGLFGVEGTAVAPVTLRADGLEAGASWWLRADPAHMFLRQSQMILQAEVPLSAEEAGSLCAALNAHFAAEGLRFFAPHPLRWYVQVDGEPAMQTHPLSQVAGKDVRPQLPHGPDALRWHGIINEIQMLLHNHEVNLAREARGEPPINSVWLWGGGRMTEKMLRPCATVCGDSELAFAFARAAGIRCTELPGEAGVGDVLVAWEGMQRAVLRGDLQAWRDSLRQFEQRYAAPLLGALRAGRIASIILDVPGEAARRFMLTRVASWKPWRRPRPLADHALV